MLRIWLTAIVLLTSFSAHACNVPVFRYALERWQADPPEIIVFHRDDLTAVEQQAVDELRAAARLETGAARFDVLVRNIGEELEPDLKKRWQEIGEQPILPHVLVQHRTSGIMLWRGSLSEFDAQQTLRSPLLESLAARTLAGDSVIWIMMQGSNAARAERAKRVLEAELKDLEQGVALPDGIGEPGSELLSQIPMKISFSIAEFDAADPNERFLTALFTRFSPDAVADGESLFIPVFGRGRALEVLSGDLIEPSLVQEITSFLCGACSCTVKEINPGFDLPLLIDWDAALFEGDLPAALASRPPGSESADPPVAIAIAPGKKKSTSSPSSIRAHQEIDPGKLATAEKGERPIARQRQARRFDGVDPRVPRFALVGLLGLVSLVLVGERLGRKRPA